MLKLRGVCDAIAANEVAQLDQRVVYLEKLSQEKGSISLLLIQNPFPAMHLNDELHHLVLVVTNSFGVGADTEHWKWGNSRIQVRRVTPEMLESMVMDSLNLNMMLWLNRGEILYDRDHYLTNLRNQLMQWSPLIREQKLLSEFSQFVRCYLHAKQDLQDRQVLDAYSNILRSLHYWAHLALVEEGLHPERTVWEQVRKVNPGIYKLFEELTTSDETLEQRVQLVLLACEFNIVNKMESSCALLIRLINSRNEAWTPDQLLKHPQLNGLPIELSILLQKLVRRGCIREVANPLLATAKGLSEISYTSAIG